MAANVWWPISQPADFVEVFSDRTTCEARSKKISSHIQLPPVYRVGVALDLRANEFINISAAYKV
jgi:hypothetical protein